MDIKQPTEEGVASTAAPDQGRANAQENGEVRSKNTRETLRKNSTSTSASTLNEKQLQVTKGDLAKVNSDERLAPEKSKSKPKPQAILEELMLNIENNEDVGDIPVRRRTSSLQRRSEHNTRSGNRLSIDEKNRRRYSSASYNTSEVRSATGSTSLAESRASHMSSSRGKFVFVIVTVSVATPLGT